MKTALIALTLLAAACTSSNLDVPPLSGRTAGCGDAALYRVSADNGTVLSLYWPGAATGTWEPNDTTKTIVGDIGTQGIEVWMQVGRYLDQLVCNDAIENDPVVERVYAGVSGSVELTLTIEEGGDATTPTATARITELVLETIDGKAIEIDEVAFEPVRVGWFVG